MELRTEYHRALLAPHRLKRSIQLLVAAINRSGLRVPIAVRGVSGFVVAGAVSAELGLPLVIVRKGTDGCHSDYLVEGPRELTDYIIIDDFLSSGDTIQAIYRDVASTYRPARVSLRGVFMYGPGRKWVEGRENEKGKWVSGHTCGRYSCRVDCNGTPKTWERIGELIELITPKGSKNDVPTKKPVSRNVPAIRIKKLGLSKSTWSYPKWLRSSASFKSIGGIRSRSGNELQGPGQT